MTGTLGLMAKREGFKIFVNSAEFRAFEERREALGQSQREAATRLFRWFLQQDATIQCAVLDTLPQGDRRDILKLVMKRLEKAQNRKVKPGSGVVSAEQVLGQNPSPAPTRKTERKNEAAS